MLTLAQLEELSLDVLPDALLPLRDSRTLLRIDADAYRGENHAGVRAAAEFWKAYDAKAAPSKPTPAN